MIFSPALRQRVVRHSLAWVVVAGLFATLSQVAQPGNLLVFGMPYSVPMLLVLAGAVYAHYGLIALFFERRQYGRFAAATVALLLAGACLLTTVSRLQGALPAAGSRTQQLAAFSMAAVNIAMALFLASSTRYVRRSIISRYQVQHLRALQLETELNLLKAQVNQHFLFNTLNNLYGLSIAAPEQMPEAVLQLAGLMRYQLDSSRQATVTVGTEAEYLANYIGLEKLRLQANTSLDFVVDLSHPQQRLVPLLLLPLVENCFKHAIGPSDKNSILIRLTQTAAGLTLRTENSIPTHFRPASSGLGLPTLRTRLAQFYPGTRHQLLIEATPTQYVATLRLVL
jgi:hypothetical protein